MQLQRFFEEMPTVIIITAYCILDNYTASISLFDKKVFKGQLQCYDKFCKTSKIPNIRNTSIELKPFQQ